MRKQIELLKDHTHIIVDDIQAGSATFECVAVNADGATVVFFELIDTPDQC